MKRIRTAVCLIAVGAFGLAACGGSDSTSSGADGGADTTAPDAAVDTTAGSDGALGTIGSVPGLSQECTDLYNEYIKALGAMGTGDQADISGVFTALKDVLPDDLDDDADLLAATWAKYQDVLKKYDGDVTKAMSDPDAIAIIQAMGDEKVNAASTAISDYFSQQCPTG